MPNVDAMCQSGNFCGQEADSADSRSYVEFCKEGRFGIRVSARSPQSTSPYDAAFSKRLVLDGGFIHQHDGNIVFYCVDAVTLPAFQTLGTLAIIERLFTRRANQNFQKIFGNHDKGIVLKIGGLGISVEPFTSPCLSLTV